VRRTAGRAIEVPSYLRETVEEIAFQAVKTSASTAVGVSQRLPITTLESVSAAPNSALPARRK